MKLPDIALVCHEANRALCEAHGDFSQVAWDQAPDWQRDSAVAGVEFRLHNPNAPESATHEAWMATKRAEGWKFGPVKDAEAKEHPCMAPFDELPPVQQAKDRLFGAVVLALAPYLEGAA